MAETPLRRFRPAQPARDDLGNAWDSWAASDHVARELPAGDSWTADDLHASFAPRSADAAAVIASADWRQGEPRSIPADGSRS